MAIVLSILLSTIFRGYVLSILWGWFLVPIGAPSITIPIAIGLSAISGMLVDTSNLKKDDSGTRTAKDAFIKAIVIAFIGPLLALLFGWIAHLFV